MHTRHMGALAVVSAVTLTVAACGGGGSDGSGGNALPAPHFVSETASGIDHVYDGEFEYFVGGGVAAFDCNDDGKDELFFAGGTRPAALYRNDSAVGGALRFTQITSPVTDLTAVTGAYPIDIDSDGIVDLAVLRRGVSVILRGVGNCAFEDANDQFGVADDGWTAAFSATWEGSNALPTLAFGHYLVPDTSDCADSALVRPAANGNVYDTPTALSPGYCTLSVLFSDWSRSGQRDLRMTNDRHYYIDGGDQMWHVPAAAAPRLYTEADGWKPLHLWGMGIASQDVTGDGRPEVFVTSQGDNKLQTLDDGATGPAYHDMALQAGVTAQRPFVGGDVLPSTAWHAEFADVNNDGLADLFVTKGNVEAQPDYASRDPNDLFIGQSDATFVEGAEQAGIVSFDKSRGAALVDLNLDGLLDLVVVNRRTDAQVWRNVGTGDTSAAQPMGHWLAVDLQQPAPNVDAIGAWVEVRTDGRVVDHEVTIGGGHAGGQLGWIHLGLGSAATADVRVLWPDGSTGPWMTITADQFVTVERGETAPRPWTPGQPLLHQGEAP